MTDIEIEEDFWSHKYFDYLEEKRIAPYIDEFDTNEIDEEMEKWAKEDADFLARQEILADESEWETVQSNHIEIG